MKQLARDEMKLIYGGVLPSNPCYPITCCLPQDSPNCIAGPCVGSTGCTDYCQCNGSIH